MSIKKKLKNVYENKKGIKMYAYIDTKKFMLNYK